MVRAAENRSFTERASLLELFIGFLNVAFCNVGGGYGNVVHAIVQASEPLTPAGLEEFLRSKLTKYKRPRTYEFVSEPLRGDDGKVRRPALRAQRLATARR